MKNDMSLLLVTDSRKVVRELEKILTKAGFLQVFKAELVEKVYQALGLHGHQATMPGIDLVLLDNRMAEVDGMEICRQLKESKTHSQIPVVMMTGQEHVEELASFFSAGAVDYITQPFSGMEVRARVCSALRLKEAMDSRRARELELLEVSRKLAEANRTLNKMAYLDGLTGIANRRYFEEFLHKEWRRASRRGRTLGLIMIDIDYFKAYNDIYGHQDGDDCLKRVAQALDAVMKRPGDHVTRYGGEEFAVLLGEELSVGGASRVAEKLRAAVAALGIEHSGSQIGDYVTISLGVAIAEPDPKGLPDKLLVFADKALYAAKDAGRDRIHIATEVLK